MSKKPFVSKEKLDEIAAQYATPFYLYDEAAIRETARRVNKAFAWNQGFKEYFAVKATPNPAILKILHEEGCGADCSSYTELQMADAVGFKGDEIMFSSNATPAEDFQLARQLNVTINLDDITHIDFLEKVADIPDTVSCRYNPGGHFAIANNIMDNPGDAKYGMTREQMTEAYKILLSKGVKHFGMHAFLASNTVTNDYYPELARILFQVAVELKEETTGGAYCTYPGRDDTCLQSIRQKVFGEGVNDMRALQLLEQLTDFETACQTLDAAFGQTVDFHTCPQLPEQLLAVREAINQAISMHL